MRQSFGSSLPVTSGVYSGRIWRRGYFHLTPFGYCHMCTFVFLFHINLVSVSFSLLCVVSCLSWFPCVVIDVTCCKRVFGLSLPVTSGDQYSSRNSRQGYLKSVGMGCFGGCIVPWSNDLPPFGLQHMWLVCYLILVSVCFLFVALYCVCNSLTSRLYLLCNGFLVSKLRSFYTCYSTMFCMSIHVASGDQEQKLKTGIYALSGTDEVQLVEMKCCGKWLLPCR